MGKKILLADDSITIQKVIELTFSDEDFDVVTVGNGRLAIERLPEVQPDIVLCDIIMPEKDGYEVCEFIKGNPAFAHVPVLLLTGAFEPFDQERAARVGSDGHLAKPFEPQTLISKVKELLGGAGRPAAAAPARPTAFTPPAAAAPREVSFIPEEPFAGADTARASTAADAEYAVADDEFYGVVEQVTEAPELEPEPQVESAYSGEAAAYQVADEPTPEQPAAGGRGAKAGAPWVQPTVEVSWEDRAQAAGETPVAYAETPVFDEVLEPEGGGAPQPVPSTGAAPRPASEPESIPPMLLEYEPSPEPAARAQAPARPFAPTPPSARPKAEPSAADFLEEQAITLEADELAAPALGRAPLSPPSAEVSFADIAPAAAAGPAPMTAPSVAAEVPVPVDMVAQIAQRVVGQLSEKVIREVVWEILPDLAEALIKKEIDRLTAELKEP